MKIDTTRNNIRLKLYQPGQLESKILVSLEYLILFYSLSHNGPFAVLQNSTFGFLYLRTARISDKCRNNCKWWWFLWFDANVNTNVNVDCYCQCLKCKITLDMSTYRAELNLNPIGKNVWKQFLFSKTSRPIKSFNCGAVLLSPMMVFWWHFLLRRQICTIYSWLERRDNTRKIK